MEYNTIPSCEFEPSSTYSRGYGKIDSFGTPPDWKVGAFEPTENVDNHGDLEYIYTIDLDAKTITHKEA